MKNAQPIPTLRVLQPHPFVYAFYDGRVEGAEAQAQPTWVDDEYELGLAAYVLVDDRDALIYDTHMSLAHAARIRKFVEALGVTRMRVVLSHWHLDHVAGNEVFQDCEIIAQERTLQHLQANALAIEDGTLWGPPIIAPLVMPTTTYHERLHLTVGRLAVDLLHANIHSDDATLLHIPACRLLLAGDALEDTVTFVNEPAAFNIHLAELERLWSLDIDHILPNHGDPAIIAAGGYGTSLIRATQQYITTLQRCVTESALRTVDLQSFLSGPLQEGWITYFSPYEAVHRRNVALVVESTDLKQ